MKIEVWDIERPKDYPQNARKHGPRALQKLAASIRLYGWRQPVVVDKDEVIIIGHLRRAAARMMGLKECPVHIASDLTPEQVRGLRLADNRTHQEAIWDEAQLRLELAGLQELDFDLRATGFDVDQIAKPEQYDPAPPPPSVERNVEELKRIEQVQKIREIRKKGVEKVQAADDTERFLVIVFPSRAAKEERLRALGLPLDERYLSANAISLQLVGENLVSGKSASTKQSGACGAMK